MHPSTYEVCIVGAGISGLSVAAFLAQQRPELSLLVLEQSSEPGGAIRSFSDAGYLAEWGAHGFLDNCAESRALIHLAGLEGELTTAPLAEFVRYICLDGRLRLIPQQPLAILRQPLVPLAAKLRVVAELWQGPLAGEPSVAEWVAHRFGAALLPFADAVFTGTFAGDIERLKIDAVMPGVREMERECGSVIRGAFKRMRARSREGGGKKGLPAMISFSAGMGRLPRALAARLEQQGQLSLGNGVREVTPTAEGWQVAAEQGEYRCRRLVLALPVNRVLPLMHRALPELPPPLAAIPEARIATVMLGFDQRRAEIPFGFGYLAPEQEQRFTLGALFSSHMFPGRAPAGHHLLEALVGGRRHPERLELSDRELVEAVCADLGRLMRLPEPAYSTVLRPSAGIPQLEEGYTGLLAWRRRLGQRHPDLHLCGFGWKGIGINDMIKEAHRLAAGIGSQAAGQERTEVKGVYF